MRLITWNCRVGGFKDKAQRIAALRPDVLVVQESENLDSVLPLSGVEQPTFRHRTNDPRFPKRGTAVFSYTGTSIETVDGDNAAFGFNRYEVRSGGTHFNVAAVWTWATKASADSYRQAHRGLSEHSDWVRQRPTVMLGDFNLNKTSSGKRWKELEALLDSAGFVSVYHTKSREGFGSEKQSTHFHLGNARKGFHIDYCFVLKDWESSILNVQVPAYSEWRDVSDHVPLIVDLAL